MTYADETTMTRRRKRCPFHAKLLLLSLFAAVIILPFASCTTVVLCDGQDAVLSCSGGEVIKISEAHYGRNERYSCETFRPKESTMKCELPRALHIVKQKCEHKGKCQFTVGRETFLDPCPSASKYLSVIYECSPLLESCKGSIWNVTSQVTYTVEKEKDSEGGAWMRDPLQRNSKVYRMESVPFSSPSLWEYSTPENMSRGGGSAITFYHMSENVDGTGFVVYDERLYFNKASTREIVKMALHNRKVEARFELPHANYHNTSPYAIELDTDIDLAVDENGLWAIYATESNQGLIVISKLDRHALDVMRTYNTAYDKMSALNAFMACGCLYVVNYTTLVIDYKYNTTSEKGEKINIAIPGLNRTATSINYNPKDHKLYVWDQKLSLYTVEFMQPTANTVIASTTRKPAAGGPTPTSRTPATTTTTTVASDAGDNNGGGDNDNGGRPPRPEKPVTEEPVTDTRRCPSRTSSGLTWPTTSYNEMAKLSCPGIGTEGGVATWSCSGNATHAQWAGEGADFEQCTSSWLIALRKSITERNVLNKCNALLKELQKYELNLRSWDIIATVDALQVLLDRAGDDPSNAATLTDNFVKIAGLLLHVKMEELWSRLQVPLQRRTSTRLLGLLEDVGLFFFTDVMRERDYIPTWSSNSVTLKLVITHSNDVASASWEQSDTVRVDLRDVTLEGRLGSNDKVAVLFIKLTTIGKYMQDPIHLGSSSYPVNSDLMVVTVASIDMATATTGGQDHRATPRRLQIKSGSVQLRFSPSTGFAKQTCAFWNVTSNEQGEVDGFWSHKGCRTVNVDHRDVTCQCNHTTPFAVLASNGEFPAAWFQRSTETPAGVDPDETGAGGEVGVSEATLFEFISIVRVGLVFSILVQAIVVVVLAFYSHKLDSNTINKNVSMCAILTAIVLAFGINQTHDGKLCSVVAVLLHVGILASACWSSLACLHLLIADERTTDNKRWKFYYILGYGVPLLCVVITVAVDYTVYRGEKICWIDSRSDAIYGVVVPLLAGVVFAVVCVAIILRKLHCSADLSHQTMKRTTLRRSTQKLCILYSLMAAMWSSLIPWMSGTSQQITAWLFCIFTIFYSLACLLLFCVFDTKVRRKCCKWLHHIKKDDFSRHHHVRNAGRRHLVPPMDHRTTAGFPLVNHPNVQRNNLPCNEEYRPLPPTGAPRAQTLNFAESQMGMVEGATNRPLIGSAASLPHDLVANCTASCCGACRPDDSKPEIPRNHDDRGPRCSGASSSNSWNNYVQHQRTTTASNGPAHMTTQVRHCSSCNSNECTLQRQYDRASRTDGHFYEQPVHHLAFCQCTQSSGTSSGCYDHLHDEVGARHAGGAGGAGGSRRTRPSKCRCNSGGGGGRNVVTPPESTCPRPSHFYETLGPFRESPQLQQVQQQQQQQPLDDSVGADPRRQSNAAILPYHNSNTGPNFDLGTTMTQQQQEQQQAQQQRYNRQQHHRPPPPQQQQQQYFDRSSISSSSAERASTHTSSFERDVLTHHHHPRSATNQPPPPRHHHRTAAAVPYAHRCDPRSIRTLPEDARLCDEGEDGAPRIKASFTCTGGCRRNGRSSDPLSTDQGYDTDSQMQNRREITPPRDDIQTARRTELKRLVKPPKIAVSGREITFSDSENDLEVENIIGGDAASQSPPPPPSSHHHDDEAIDTERGGLISPSDTVTSWAALGPDPVACYGGSKQLKRQYNSAAGGDVVVAQQQRRNSSVGGGSEGPCSYTLPGTSDAATKARIDLRTGGVNMITNL